MYNRIALDVACLDIRHAMLDNQGRYEKTRKSKLNECLTVEANLDETARAFRQWQVRTKGIYNEYGDWSASRTLNVVTQPIIEFGISQESKWYWDLLNFNDGDILSTEGELGEESNTITEYPFYISALVGPNTQRVLRWYISIIADDESHESYNEEGSLKVVNKGDVIYSKHFDGDEDNRLFLQISAADAILDNNCSYSINVKAVMDDKMQAYI